MHKRSRNITLGKITIRIDNSKVYKRLVNEICKASYFLQDAGAEIVQIRKLVSEIKYDIEFRLVKNNKR